MAYIHKKTFDIIQTGNPRSLSTDWFYADDLLADTLQVLNARGYRTVSSGIGVPYCTAREILLRNVRDDSGKAPETAEIAKAYRRRVPGANILRIDRLNLRDFKLTRRDYSSQCVFISFENEFCFHKLPKDTTYENGVLRHTFPEGVVGFDFIEAQHKYCSSLFDWSCSLPFNLFLNML